MQVGNLCKGHIHCPMNHCKMSFISKELSVWYCGIQVSLCSRKPVDERQALDPFDFTRGSTSQAFSLQLPKAQTEVQDCLSSRGN